MNDKMDKLNELFETFYRTNCNHECDKCPLNKTFEDEEYKNKNVCDVLEDVYDVIKEDL